MTTDWEMQAADFNREMIDSLKLQREVVETGLKALVANSCADNIIYYASAARTLLSKIDDSMEYYENKIAEAEEKAAEDEARLAAMKERARQEGYLSNEEH